MPFVKPQFLDNSGDPAAGYQLFVYDSGGTNKQPTWSDQGLSAANANPIVLDSAGRASIFLAAQTHRFKLASPTAADPPDAGDTIWDVDNVASLPYYDVSTAVTVAGTDIDWSISGATLTLVSPPSPAIASAYYVNSATSSTAIDIPAGTLFSGGASVGSVVCEWETDYSAAKLQPRAAAFGTNVDMPSAGAPATNSTLSRARYVFSPVTNTTIHYSTTVLQNTGAGAIQVIAEQGTIGSLNLTTTGYTITLGMASGTYTVRGVRLYVLPIQTDLLA